VPGKKPDEFHIKSVTTSGDKIGINDPQVSNDALFPDLIKIIAGHGRNRQRKQKNHPPNGGPIKNRFFSIIAYPFSRHKAAFPRGLIF
jgi:hypothetical protein